MRNNVPENLMEHSFQVAVIAQALALIKNKKFGASVDVDKVVSVALFHDAGEVFTGDMPTPIIDIETIVSPLFLSVVTR